MGLFKQFSVLFYNFLVTCIWKRQMLFDRGNNCVCLLFYPVAGACLVWLAINFFSKQSCLCLLKLHAAGLHNLYFFYFWCCLLTASLSFFFLIFFNTVVFEQSMGAVMLRATSTLFSPDNIPAISWLTPQSVWERNISIKCICIFLMLGNKRVFFLCTEMGSGMILHPGLWILPCLSHLSSCWLAVRSRPHFFTGLYNPYLCSWHCNLSCSGT